MSNILYGRGSQDDKAGIAIVLLIVNVLKNLNIGSIQNYKSAGKYLKMWYNWAIRSKIDEIKEVAKTIKRHWDGIREFIKSRINNGIVEGVNSKIKAALKRAYGFKSFEYYRTIIYLIVGKLEFSLPIQS